MQDQYQTFWGETRRNVRQGKTLRQSCSCKIVTNQWFNTIHAHVKLRMAMFDKVNIKQALLSSKRKKILKSYRANPINGGPAKIISTGVETCPKIIQVCLKHRNKETYFRNYYNYFS